MGIEQLPAESLLPPSLYSNSPECNISLTYTNNYAGSTISINNRITQMEMRPAEKNSLGLKRSVSVLSVLIASSPCLQLCVCLSKDFVTDKSLGAQAELSCTPHAVFYPCCELLLLNNTREQAEGISYRISSLHLPFSFAKLLFRFSGKSRQLWQHGSAFIAIARQEPWGASTARLHVGTPSVTTASPRIRHPWEARAPHWRMWYKHSYHTMLNSSETEHSVYDIPPRDERPAVWYSNICLQLSLEIHFEKHFLCHICTWSSFINSYSFLIIM